MLPSSSLALLGRCAIALSPLYNLGTLASAPFPPCQALSACEDPASR